MSNQTVVFLMKKKILRKQKSNTPSVVELHARYTDCIRAQVYNLCLELRCTFRSEIIHMK